MNAAISSEVFRLHGGKLRAARGVFREAREPWIDLSTGISPWCYPLDALGPEALTRLPDPEDICVLEAAAGESFGIGAPRVIATPGSDLALRALGRVFAGRRVAVVRPGYSGHVLTWGDAPVTLVGVDDLELAAREHEVVLLANPNNPDGRLIERARLLVVAEQFSRASPPHAGESRSGGALIVDEAFADLAPEHSLCGALDEPLSRSLIVFRSFGKFFGLAGVRLGFVICDAVSARHFRQALGDWPVSGPAVALGTAAYRDTEWQTMQRQRLAAAAARLDGLLTRAGLSVIGGTALFRLARCAGADGVAGADALFRHLATHGILTRPFASDPTLLRFGLPGEEAHWRRLALALHSRDMQ